MLCKLGDTLSDIFDKLGFYTDEVIKLIGSSNNSPTDKLLSKNSDYEYINDKLVLPNVSGDIKIHYKMPICQRATVLHTEKCLGSYCSGMGYKPNGSMGSSTITYGSLGTASVLTSGDAFDCDVNGDGIYDAETERFYYVTDLDNNKITDKEVDFYFNRVNSKLGMYSIIKTDNEEVIKDYEKYYKTKYKVYTKKELSDNYYVFVANGDKNLDLSNLDTCSK